MTKPLWPKSNEDRNAHSSHHKKLHRRDGFQVESCCDYHAMKQKILMEWNGLASADGPLLC